MNKPIPAIDSLDDDSPALPDPGEDSMKSAQFRRYWREQLKEEQYDHNRT